MPRIPDLDSFGARPIPQSQRSISSNPFAGAVGAAVSDLGQTVQGVGNQLLEKQDKFQYAAAKSSLLKADVDIRQALQDDPDYSTYEARYTAAMTKARAAATSMLGNRGDRPIFEQDAQNDILRGQTAIAGVVRTKRTAADKAVLSQGLSDLRVSARDAEDEGTRVAAFTTASEMIQAAQDRGLLAPDDAVALRQSWSSDYAAEQVSIALSKEDPDAARGILTQFGDKLDWRTRLSLEDRLKRTDDYRDAVGGVSSLMGTATRDEGSTVPYGDPLRGKGQGPVKGGQYGASRDYGGHQGVDFPAANGTPIFGVAGTAKVAKSDKGGNIVTVTQPNGTQWKYMHLGAVTVKDGEAVTADTRIGTVGMTGRSSGPHLHVEVWQGGKPVDPEKVIGKAQQSPQRHDLNDIYSQIDAKADAEGWTPERRERWKDEATRRVSRDEQLVARQEQSAMRSALDVIDRLDDKFTDTSQIPNFDKLAPDDRIRLEGIAKANREPKEAKPNGEAVVTLHQQAYLAPDRFKATDLRAFRSQMSPAEYDQLSTLQAQMIAKPESNEQVKHSQIWGIIGRYGPDVGVDFSAQKKGEKEPAFKARRAEGMALFQTMQSYLNVLTGGQRQPTDDETKRAFDNAVMRFRAPDGNVAEKFRIPSLSKTGIAVPIAIHDRIAARLKAAGLPYDDQTVARVYIQGK